MKLYRKRVATVEAVQFDGTGSSAAEILEWTAGGATFYPNENRLALRVNGFLVNVREGDYVVRTATGGFVTRTADHFNAVYEPVLKH